MPTNAPTAHANPPQPVVPGAVAVHRANHSGPCPSCGRLTRRLHRLKVRDGEPWVAACALCAAALLEREAGSLYGGTITTTRRRRRAG